MVTATSGPSGSAWQDAVRHQDSHQHLTTLEGWRQFVTDAPRPPELPSTPSRHRTRLDTADRTDNDDHDDDDARLDYHTRLTVVATSALRHVVHTGRRLILLNRHAISARRGLIVSGAAGTGKTTAITQFGKTHEVIDHQHHHGPGGNRIPVVYVTVPPAATPRMLAVEFARFLGLPITTRANITDVIEAVCGVCCDTSTTLVLVDEIHNLALTTRNGAEVSDTLKYFSERIPATFVYAGVDVERAGLFAGTRGQQLAGRFGLIPTVPFPYATEWQGLVVTLEGALRLHRHQPGTLAGLDRYLHQRTGGMIGSLSHLIRGAAIEAILAGSEQITKATLDAVGLDHAAQARRAGRA